MRSVSEGGDSSPLSIHVALPSKRKRRQVGAVQTPGAPHLSVLRTTTNTVCVWWPLPDTGWTLQATTNLVSTGSVWVDYSPPYQTNATSVYYIEPLPAGNKFYRLKK